MSTTKITSLTECIESAVTSRLADTYHTLPGIVVAYYPSTQEADIQIAINDPRFNPDDDTLETEPWPIYPKVRVAWPRFGGFTLIGPLLAGDKVECHFQDLDDSNYRTTGQQGDPAFTRRHGSDGIWCVPLDVTDAGVSTDAATVGTTVMIMGKDGAQNQIRFDGTTIQLGATHGDHIALASKVDGYLAALKTFATSVAGAANLAAVNAAGTTLAAALGTPSTGSTLIKAQ